MKELEEKKPKKAQKQTKISLYSDQLKAGLHCGCTVTHKEVGAKNKILIGFSNESGRFIESFSQEEAVNYTPDSVWRILIKEQGEYLLTQTDNGKWLLKNERTKKEEVVDTVEEVYNRNIKLKKLRIIGVYK